MLAGPRCPSCSQLDGQSVGPKHAKSFAVFTRTAEKESDMAAGMVNVKNDRVREMAIPDAGAARRRPQFSAHVILRFLVLDGLGLPNTLYGKPK